MMMTKEQFIRELTEKLQDLCQADWDSICYDKKKESICFSRKFGEVESAARCQIGDIYQSYLDTRESVGSIAISLADTIRAAGKDVQSFAAKASQYEKMRPNLTVKVAPYEESLEEFVIQRIGKIALVLCFFSYNDSQEMQMVPIPKILPEEWKMEESAVFRAAMDNTLQMFPPKVFEYSKIAEDPLYEGIDILHQKCSFPDMEMAAVSNSMKSNGAVSIFLPGVAEKLSSMMNGDFYFVCMDIHESIIHSTKIEPETIGYVAQETALDYLEEGLLTLKELLPQTVYRYRALENKFEIVEIG